MPGVFFSFHEFLAKENLSVNHENASESFAFWAPERASEEPRRLCLALMRFYMKIIQIRALDYVEAVYQATKKKKTRWSLV